MAPPAKVVIVTGCSTGGIGSELCKSFHKAGCIVYPTVRDVSKAADLQAMGMHILKVDVTDVKGIESAVAEVIQREGRIDILANNAAMFRLGPWLEIDLHDVESVFSTNLHGAIAFAQKAGKHMAQRRSGLIINIGSGAEWMPAPIVGSYAASKAALDSFSRSLRMELRPFSVQVMHVTLGYVKTNLQSQVPVPEIGKSMYAPVLPEAYEKILLSSPTATPAEKVARGLVSAALRRSPPRTWLGGEQGQLLRFLHSFCPIWLLDFMLMSHTGMFKMLGYVRATDRKS